MNKSQSFGSFAAPQSPDARCVSSASAGRGASAGRELRQLSLIDELVDQRAWIRLLKLRRFPMQADPLGHVEPEVLAKYPEHWVAAARRGEFVMPAEPVDGQLGGAR